MPESCTEEILVPFAGPRHLLPVTTLVRTSWLVSSLRSLRERGLLETYYGLLAKPYREIMQTPVVGSWLPIDVAVAHYEACDSLALPAPELLAIGNEVTRFAHKTAYALALRLATGVGVTPWTCLGLQHRLWSQVFTGGGVATYKLGPKAARVEIAAWPLARFEYIRVALRGVLTGQTELFCERARTEEITTMRGPLTLGYRVTWT